MREDASHETRPMVAMKPDRDVVCWTCGGLLLFMGRTDEGLTRYRCYSCRYRRHVNEGYVDVKEDDE